MKTTFLLALLVLPGFARSQVDLRPDYNIGFTAGAAVDWFGEPLLLLHGLGGLLHVQVAHGLTSASRPGKPDNACRGASSSARRADSVCLTSSPDDPFGGVRQDGVARVDA